MEAVWQVKWVDKGTERGECLVSVSTDGRIAEWSMKKGLASSTLMVLRRSGNAEGSISRTAAGLSFDFPIG
jgi:dynein intermediate chain 4, axonemal